jgi:uncharacterized protein (DUF927 family)/5S rRNA maturation endonuclease (ribonuclease M5)
LEQQLTGGDFKAARAEVFRVVGRAEDPGRKSLDARIVEAYRYVDEKGELLFEVVRLKDPKDFRQRKPDGRGGWAWSVRGVRAVLYRLPELLRRRSDVAFIVEGEKDVHALESLGLLATTNPGGAGKWRAEYSEALRGRRCAVLPDNDGPGRKHAAAVAESLLVAGCEIRIAELPKGKDAADWVSAGGTPEALRQLTEAAEVVTPDVLARLRKRWSDGDTGACESGAADARVSQHTRFRLKDDGVYYCAPGGDKKPLRICGRLTVEAITRDSEGTGWGRLLKWKDVEGGEHEWPMPVSLLAGEGSEYRARLLDGGLFITSGRGIGPLLSEYIQTTQTTARALCVSRVGWHGESFVLPGETIGPNGADRVLFQTQHDSENYFGVAGAVEDWREHVGRLCIGNSRLMLAASCAFAGPVLSLMGAESGGVHLVGYTSTGKSTALVVCGSVLGGGGKNGFVQTWNATANGLEATAALHNDLTLPLDEMAQVLPEEAAEIAYLLANGTGKARMSRNVAARRKLTWTLLFLSAGEVTLADHARTTGKRIRGGVEVRLLDIDADAGAGMGLFENLHGAASPDLFARQLKEAARAYYGAPLRAFLRSVVSNRAACEASLRGLRDDFMQRVPEKAGGELSRAAARLALIAGAGELATRAGLTGWPEGAATDAAARCYKDWWTARGTVGGSDTEAAVRDVRRFIEKHGASRFQVIRHPIGEASPDENQVVKDRAGFRRRNDDGETEYWILKEVFRQELCRDFNSKLVARALAERGYLDTQGDTLMKAVRVPEMGWIRAYCVRASILEDRDSA